MLACPNCGAPAAPSAVRCTHCRAQLATVACAGCFGMNFVGAQHCSHCGARIFRAQGSSLPAGTRACPRCRVARLTVSAVGEVLLEECARCGGLWVDAGSFKRLCEHREERAAFVGAGSPVPPPSRAVTPGEVSYLPCPECGKIMNRVNFGRRSGVVVDVCRTHGTWFDRDELREVLAFIQGGGLEEARRRELERLHEESQRLRERERAGGALEPPDEARPHGSLLDVAGDLLGWLLR